MRLEEELIERTFLDSQLCCSDLLLSGTISILCRLPVLCILFLFSDISKVTCTLFFFSEFGLLPFNCPKTSQPVALLFLLCFRHDRNYSSSRSRVRDANEVAQGRWYSREGQSREKALTIDQIFNILPDVLVSSCTK